MIRGKWHVIVSIPAHMRHLYNNTQRDKRFSTKTTDKSTAQRMQHSISQRIYDEFDAKLGEYAARHDEITDDFAVSALKGIAKCFNHKPIPALIPTTDYGELIDFKNAVYVYANLIMNSFNDEDKQRILEAFAKLDRVASKQSDQPHYKVELKAAEDTLLASFEDGSQYTMHHHSLATDVLSVLVHSFWQDLLILAARQQGLVEPRPEPFKGSNNPHALIGGEITIDSPLRRKLTASAHDIEPISRPARIEPIGVRTLSTVMDEYLNDMRLKQPVVDTQKKLTRWAKQFLSVMGDLEIVEIKTNHAYNYIRKILIDHPDRSNKTLKDYIWGIQNLLKYCVESGYIEYNPFQNVKVEYGIRSKETYPYTNEELRAIFAHDWPEQERLILTILATTGMRPSEAGNLTWERFNDTEYGGIRYFTTYNTEKEDVRIKNAGSRRDIPLHPELRLPDRANGRLFDYALDSDGRCSTRMAHIINPILQQLVPHPNKSLRSFRRTFKKMMRDLGVGEEVHDAITGHDQGRSSSRKNYGGMNLPIKFEAIKKLDASIWLNA